MSEKLNRVCPHCGQECTRQDWNVMNSMMAHDENGNAYLYHPFCVQHVKGDTGVHSAEHPANGCHLCVANGWIYKSPFPTFKEWLAQQPKLDTEAAMNLHDWIEAEQQAYAAAMAAYEKSVEWAKQTGFPLEWLAKPTPPANPMSYANSPAPQPERKPRYYTPGNPMRRKKRN